MTKNIKDILAAYDFILENKKVVFGEADISGIDELVYNPATKSGGSIGHGYDGGKKVNGITWNNHDNHLHIGFTNRDVAMAVIDKADQLGLTTTENPYAKKDPNGKVDKVHTSGSFHYKIFPGEPKVGAGVDISGNSSRITELIKWVETNYAGGSYPEQKTVDYVEPGSTGIDTSTSSNSDRYSSGDPLISQVAGQAISNTLGLNETIKEASLFGGNSFKWGGGPRDHGSRKLGNWQSDNAWDIMASEGTAVYSISDGTVSKVGGSEKLSPNGVVYGYQITIDTNNNSIFYTHLINLSSKIKPGSKINKGDLIGYIGKPKENDKWPTHVHIGIKNGDIKQYINTNADIIGAENVDTSSESNDNTSSIVSNLTKSKGKDYSGGDPIISSVFGKIFDKTFGLNEASSKSPTFYLTFCNVSNLMNLKNGQKISQGEVIGKTTTDIKVVKLDDLFNKSNIKKGDFNLGKNVTYSFGEAEIPAKSNEKIKSPISGIVNNSRFVNCKNPITIESKTDDKEFNRDNKEVGSSDYADPFVGNVLSAPFKLFQDKYDESGKLKQKRWGHTGEKVDPWIVDTLSAPFKKIGKIFKEEEERKNKKLNENINNIKRLMK